VDLEDVVGDVDHQKTLVAQLQRQLVDMLAFTHRQVIGRLVHDDDAVLEFDRAPDLDRLAFTAREALDLIIGRDVVTQPEGADHLCRFTAHLREVEKRYAEDLLYRLPAEVEIPRNREVVAQSDGLLDRLDSLVDGELGVELLHEFAVEIDLAVRRLVDTAKDADECRLAGPVVTHQAHKLACVEIDRDILQRVEVSKVEIQVFDLDQGLCIGHGLLLPPYTL
jgi:hypothetical protein